MKAPIPRLIFLTLTLVFAGVVGAQEPVPDDTLQAMPEADRPWTWPAGITGREPMWDTDSLPPWITDENPFRMLSLMAAFTVPVLDHTGKPHRHGHAIQVIQDGGNGRQDPPLADGSPGGDDSLAFGNFNMIRLDGLELPVDSDGATGLFFSHRYFVPYLEGKRYYLRVWEGADVKTAPYYQDSREYKSDNDRGGAMLFMRSNSMPSDVEWQFGAAKPRPKT